MTLVVERIELVKYRDAGLPTYTWFWVTSNHKVISPYFDSEEDAMSWKNDNHSTTEWDNWKSIK